MAWNAGARLINMEFVQFHPTTFHKDGVPNFLISEAVRGAGARLVNAMGEPFMHRYAPEWKDLAPRDIVARSIHREMLSQGLTHVYLDLRSYIPRDEILAHFPTIAESCLEHGIDITRDLVPVVPAAHFSCGGVWTDEWGRTTLGTCTRPGRSPARAYTARTASPAPRFSKGSSGAAGPGRTSCGACRAAACIPPRTSRPGRTRPAMSPDPALIQQDMSAIKHIMWNYVGLVRTTARLNRALSELRHLEGEILHFYRRSKLTDELIGLRHAVHTALIVAQAAWENKESVGRALQRMNPAGMGMRGCFYVHPLIPAKTRRHAPAINVRTSPRVSRRKWHKFPVPLASMFPPASPTVTNPASRIAHTPAPESSMPITDSRSSNGMPRPTRAASAYSHGCGFGDSSPSVPISPSPQWEPCRDDGVVKVLRVAQPQRPEGGHDLGIGLLVQPGRDRARS